MSVDTEPTDDLSGVRTGQFVARRADHPDRPQGPPALVVLAAGGRRSTPPRAAVAHDDLIGGPEGVVVTSVGGTTYLALRPLLNEFTVTMPRGRPSSIPRTPPRS